MKILITGIGITGKSSFRRLLVEKLRNWDFEVKHFDADLFDELHHPVDADCLKKLPAIFQPDTIYIIEDIHAPLEDAALPLEEYSFIFYLKTSMFSQILFWLPRMWQWFLAGKFSWEAEIGWQGTGVPKDYHNILPILKNFLRDVWKRKKWVKQDLKAIQLFSYQIVKSSWSLKGLRFKLIFSTK